MQTTLPIVFDKSHLITIGEKLYTQRIDFVRELVNNAYDADATKVVITVSAQQISIEDNGAGMDRQGIEQYFTIGSQEKSLHQHSAKFKRRRIGEFGIGKFAALAAAEAFEMETQRGDFRSRVFFSKKDWFSQKNWQVPFEVLSPSPLRGDGTIVNLHGLKQAFALAEIMRHICEKCPITATDFCVIVNGVIVEPIQVSGRVISVEEKTPFGLVKGKIILATKSSEEKAGINILVRGVTIRKELFNIDKSRVLGISRLRGFVQADFLPITSGRDDFIRDSAEFQYFSEVMQRHLRKALALLRDLQWRKMNEKASLVLKEALKKIGKVLRKHPEFISNSSLTPFGEEIADDYFGQKSSENGYSISRPKQVDEFIEDSTGKSAEETTEESDQMLTTQSLISEKEIKPLDKIDLEKINQIKKKKDDRSLTLAQKTVIRRLRLANSGLICRMEHVGADEPESFFQNGAVYINIDHPYYSKLEKNENMLIFHLCRLITLELALQQENNAKDALQLQDRMLRGML